MPMPRFLHHYCDVQNVFTRYYWSSSNSLKTMSAKLGVRQLANGRAHNAANDCRELAHVIHAMYRDGCDFPLSHHSVKVGTSERGESIHMPRVDVARAALLLSDASPKQVRKWLGRTGLDRNEKLLVNTGLKALRAFPESSDSLQEMAAYKHFVGPRMRFSVCLQAALICAREGWLSEAHLAFEDRVRHLLAMRDVQPLVDGGWIMERTGLEKGVKLGRLKEWLWKLQIERGATTREDMEAILRDIDWQDSDVDTWPTFSTIK
mmetsp:Transcript_19446/g.40938  ORF Transcript_19446/g.40938 Transcript_19446/m.40938 type:complete len:263 (-) Transcript_19446:139-927(-)